MTAEPATRLMKEGDWVALLSDCPDPNTRECLSKGTVVLIRGVAPMPSSPPDQSASDLSLLTPSIAMYKLSYYADVPDFMSFAVAGGKPSYIKHTQLSLQENGHLSSSQYEKGTRVYLMEDMTIRHKQQDYHFPRGTRCTVTGQISRKDPTGTRAFKARNAAETVYSVTFKVEGSHVEKFDWPRSVAATQCVPFNAVKHKKPKTAGTTPLAPAHNW